MTVRTESLNPAHLVRWMAPAAFGALLIALVAALRRRVARPAMQRMSGEWLRNHTSRATDYWP